MNGWQLLLEWHRSSRHVFRLQTKTQTQSQQHTLTHQSNKMKMRHKCMLAHVVYIDLDLGNAARHTDERAWNEILCEPHVVHIQGSASSAFIKRPDVPCDYRLSAINIFVFGGASVFVFLVLNLNLVEHVVMVVVVVFVVGHGPAGSGIGIARVAVFLSSMRLWDALSIL